MTSSFARRRRRARVLRAGAARHEAKARLGERHARVPGCVDEVAGERGLETAAERVTVHRGDHRQRQLHERHEGALEDLVLRAPDALGHAVALLEIGAGAEGTFARAGEDHAAQLTRLGGEPRPEIDLVATHLGVERVQRLRAVQRDDEDVRIVLLKQQCLIDGKVHRHSLSG